MFSEAHKDISKNMSTHHDHLHCAQRRVGLRREQLPKKHWRDELRDRQGAR